MERSPATSSSSLVPLLSRLKGRGIRIEGAQAAPASERGGLRYSRPDFLLGPLFSCSRSANFEKAPRRVARSSSSNSTRPVFCTRPPNSIR